MMATTQDVWQPYDAAAKHKPKIPEPSVTGLFIVGAAVLVMWMRRAKR